MPPAPLVLLVEDFPDTRDSLSLLLRASGFRVELAENGEDGVAKARSVSPDVILMDLRMPVLDGWEATRRIRDDPETRHVPVIAISGFDEEREKHTQAAFDAYFKKPLDVEKLLERIRGLLGSGAAERDPRG